MNTFLRWASSKRKLLPVLLDAAPDKFDRYVEPFAGSACLFFALEPPRALLGDINADLINTYRALKSDVEAVIRHLASTLARSANRKPSSCGRGKVQGVRTIRGLFPRGFGH